MFNMLMTNIQTINSKNIDIACEILSQGGLVAIPTETVYGLGADGTNADAILKMYGVKHRPSFNPLISHISDVKMLEDLAHITPMARLLIEAFCPAPLTLVLKRTETCPVPSMACAGLDTIAVRIPNHKQTLDLIAQFGKPIVAPSANKSGSISPTTAQHVYNSLGTDVDLILDGGACQGGLESTIIDVSGDIPYLLRAGAITRDMLQNVLGVSIAQMTFAKGNNPIAPGQLKSHYAPDMPLYMDIVRPNTNANAGTIDSIAVSRGINQKNHAYLGFGDCEECDLNLSPKGDLAEAGKNLFDYLHILNRQGVVAIDVAPIPNIGIGIAINDKLVRASADKKE